MDGPEDDGSWVGKNCNSMVNPDGSQSNACAVASGHRTTYTLFAEHEGPYLLYSRGDDWTKVGGGGDGGYLQFGLWGSVNVQPSGYEASKEYYGGEQRVAQPLWLAPASGGDGQT